MVGVVQVDHDHDAPLHVVTLHLYMFLKMTRLGLQCQTPALSKVYEQ